MRLKLAVRDGALDFDLCITTYENYSAEENWFKSRRWTYLVLDEGHRIKNSETQIAHKLQFIGSMYRLSTSRPVIVAPTSCSLGCSSHWHPGSE